MLVYKLNYVFAFSILAFFIFFCSKDEEGNTTDDTANSSTPNILLIIADDLGKDAIKGYQEGSINQTLPILMQL
jgi:arylsulfatase B